MFGPQLKPLSESAASLVSQQRTLSQAGIKGTHPVSTPLQSSHGTQAWSGSRDWKAAQVREIRGDKIGNSLLFSLILCRYNIDLYLFCSFVLDVSVQAPDSVMTYTYSISVLFSIFYHKDY